MASMRNQKGAPLTHGPHAGYIIRNLTGARKAHQPFPGNAWFTFCAPLHDRGRDGRPAGRPGLLPPTPPDPGPQWGEADRASYAKWQQKLGYTGDRRGRLSRAATSWNALQVPYTA